MIIDLNKFQDIKDFNSDLTDNRPVIYFLISVKPNTPRYIKKNGEYIISKDGNIVIDRGYDVFELVPRVLKYIGETAHFLSRLHDHYNKEYASEVGKVFTHFRCIKGLKRLGYDSVRIHHETLFVKKYLPEINQSAKLTDIQKLILLNSNGKVSPYNISEPYLLHARDIFLAYQAWLKEDINYIRTYLIKKKNKTGIEKPDKRNRLSFYDKKGKKMNFSSWFCSVVRKCHIKQVEAFKIHRQQYYMYIKTYVPEEHERKTKKQKINNKKFRNNNKEYLKKYSKQYSKQYRQEHRQIKLI
jgi:hypothetical protein